MQRLPSPPHHRSRQRQRGVTLFVVLVFVLLSLLLALWASRTSLFNEMVLGNDADYQRAFEAAQALLQDAELDIRGERADGLACVPDVTKPKACRAGAYEKIPLEGQELSGLIADLVNVANTHCKDGLCAKRQGAQDFWNNTDATKGATLAAMATAGVGARYGEYTGAVAGTSSIPANPILQDTSANDKGGWYWIEVLPYDESSKTSNVVVGSANLLALNVLPSAVYRITAIAYGRKSNSTVVLQQTYARQRRKD